MRNAFRRSSSCEQGKEFIETKDMILILNRMGQPVDEKELQNFIDRVDTDRKLKLIIAILIL
jgi:Ca2+-binding EF-hand superfamily protein